VDRGIAVAEEVNQPSTSISVGVVTSVYQLTVGKWDEVRRKGEIAKSLCEQLGDSRQWGDSTVLLAESALISGDVHYAIDTQKVLLEDARRRNSPLHKQWGLFGVAANNIRLGNEAAAVPMLEEALQILEDNPNLPSSINTNGQLALAFLWLGESNKALAYAGRVLGLAEGISPTVYSLDLGFAAVAGVYFELWEHALHASSEADPAPLKVSAERAIKLLRTFRRVFPIGLPYALYYQGWYESLTGRKQAAIKTWRKGLDASRKFNLPYEEGVIRIKLALASAGQSVERNEHLTRAIQIFESMGAARELGWARRVLAGESLA